MPKTKRHQDRIRAFLERQRCSCVTQVAEREAFNTRRLGCFGPDEPVEGRTSDRPSLRCGEHESVVTGRVLLDVLGQGNGNEVDG